MYLKTHIFYVWPYQKEKLKLLLHVVVLFIYMQTERLQSAIGSKIKTIILLSILRAR